MIPITPPHWPQVGAHAMLRGKYRGAYSTSTGEAEFTPLSISGCNLWLRADQGIASPVDGQAVTTWTSLEGGSVAFTQATDTKRPLYRASSINSLPALDFDGTDDYLLTASNPIATQQGTSIVVYRMDADQQFEALLSISDNPLTEYMVMYGRGETGPNEFNHPNVNALRSGTAVSIDTNYILLFASNGTTTTGRLNGAALTLTPTLGSNQGDWWGEFTSPTLAIGGGYLAGVETQFLHGKIAEIICYDSAISAGDITLVETYLATRYGITLP